MTLNEETRVFVQSDITWRQSYFRAWKLQCPFIVDVRKGAIWAILQNYLYLFDRINVIWLWNDMKVN